MARNPVWNIAARFATAFFLAKALGMVWAPGKSASMSNM
jgi:hypothetical protein